MKRQFIKATGAWIPVTVMALLAVALISSQVESGLARGVKAAPVAKISARVIEITVDKAITAGRREAKK